MQNVIGLAVLLIITIISIFIGRIWGRIWAEKASTLPNKILTFISGFSLGMISCYAILGVICGIAWIIAWIGILIREILQWLIESIFAPILWLF